MRRVKSAPANLAEMQNRRVPSILVKSTKNNIIPIVVTNNKNQEKQYNTIDKLSLIRNVKFTLRQFSTFTGDFLQTHCKTEESIILSGIIEYFSDNIFKRDKLEQVQNYMLIYIARYIFNLYIEGTISNRIDSIMSLDWISSLIN